MSIKMFAIKFIENGAFFCIDDKSDVLLFDNKSEAKTFVKSKKLKKVKVINVEVDLIITEIKKETK